jgi:hypothetical protein
MPGLILIGLPVLGVPFDKSDIQDVIAPATPVDTGYLRSRWRITADGFAIENDADYAAQVEFGYRTAKGSPVEGQFFLHGVLEQLLQHMYERNPELLEDYELWPGEFEIFVGY